MTYFQELFPVDVLRSLGELGFGGEVLLGMHNPTALQFIVKKKVILSILDSTNFVKFFANYHI